MKVRYSPRASIDLDSIYEFLNQHNPAGAARVMAAIYAPSSSSGEIHMLPK